MRSELIVSFNLVKLKLRVKKMLLRLTVDLSNALSTICCKNFNTELTTKKYRRRRKSRPPSATLQNLNLRRNLQKRKLSRVSIAPQRL